MSHTNQLLAAASSVSGLVGIDVMEAARPEGMHSDEEYFRLMQDCFTKEEWNAIRRGDQPRLHGTCPGSTTISAAFTSFLWHWTLKESYVKATGEGIGMDLRRIEIVLPNASSPGSPPHTATSGTISTDCRTNGTTDELGKADPASGFAGASTELAIDRYRVEGGSRGRGIGSLPGTPIVSSSPSSEMNAQQDVRVKVYGIYQPDWKFHSMLVHPPNPRKAAFKPSTETGERAGAGAGLSTDSAEVSLGDNCSVHLLSIAIGPFSCDATPAM